MMFLEHTHAIGNQEDSSLAASLPSLFELLMQDRMASGFKPAAEYLVQTICDAYPQTARLWLVQHFEETYAMIKFAMEKYFLERYDCLFSEKFYGMKRVMYAKEPDATTFPLTPTARRQTLVYTVLVPYLKAKLDEYYKHLVENPTNAVSSEPEPVDSSSSSSSSLLRLRRMSSKVRVQWQRFWRAWQQLSMVHTMKKAFQRSYPFVHFAYEASFFLYQWLYLFGDTPYFSPFLRCMKVILVRVTVTDEVHALFGFRAKLLSSIQGAQWFQRLRRGLLRASWATQDHSYVLLLVGIACYKFLEWMYSDDGVAAVSKVRLHAGAQAPIPPPPLPPQFSGQAMSAMSISGSRQTCPLCQQQRVNPAMSIAGFVFCYLCLYRHVETHGECPVTHMKCDLSSIIKIYDEDHTATTM